MEKFNFAGSEVLKRVKRGIGLLIFTFLFSISFMSNISAQAQTEQQGFNDAVIYFAETVGIEVSHLGTWNAEQVKNAYMSKLEALDTSEGEVALNLFTARYYENVVSAIESHNVLPEIAVVAEMSELFRRGDFSEYSNEFMLSFMKKLYYTSISDL